MIKFDPRPPILASGLQELALNATVCLGQLLSQGSIAMALSTMNVISESFSRLRGEDIPQSQQVWFMGSYALTLGTFILVSGRLGDLFGLKKIFTIGWFWATLWCLITGLSYYSHSSEFFIVCRAFQGIGFALILPCGMGILGTVYPNGKRKNLAFGCVGAAAPAGATIGCLMAGVVAQTWWWPWAFWLLSITCFLLGCLALYAIPEGFEHKQPTLKEAYEKFDLIGSVLGIVALILFNFVWNQGPVDGWSSAYIIVLLVVSVLLIALFFFYELHMAKHPLLPRGIFTFRVGLVLSCMGLGWGSFGVWQYYYWSFMLNLREYTPINTALTYIPLLVLGVFAALIVGFFISKRNAPYIIFFAMVGFMCGLIFLSILPIDQTFWRLSFGQMFLLTWGMDFSFPAASLILSDFLPKEHQGMAGSLVNTVVNYSVSLFLAIGSTVEIEVFEKTNDTLQSYRAAAYFGTGIAALSVVISIIFIFTEHGNDSLPEYHSDEVKESSSNEST
ncbi:hypothetical protein FT663_03426 [Candidozyma haemuli var. vulneris]|uniref:Major facilitator superfamily (MFS) profile domain-containing protein n=1 Tax=Candidozyma haemuli TaxID=45357 RepID=A0A2V1AYT4_9ASCO|nr:hypothetical protein CXQ85_002967 [[Candida] haemuloni]KAF3989855.1 hypothetical protein FT663_03426 [[Candida] haemuloni var. vulneris]KAF3991401.1 hypothetical protein FT662_01756 [[Candida] haemuloni var. vulneris]PVH23237.1 hypothetical protein CXQ85_002967 [[Candida] haemuloni]